MPSNSLRVLVIAADSNEAEQISRALASTRGALEAVWGLFEITVVRRLTDAIPLARSGGFDAALLSLSLPDSQGIHTLIKFLASAPHLPVVVLADESDECAALALIHHGAQDYLLRHERSPRLLRRIVQVSIQRKRAEREVAESRLGIIWRLAKAAEYRDEETGNHVVRVGCYSKIIAERLGLDRNFVENVFLTAPLHDIGKIGVPDAILRKPGPLTAEEWAIMRQHCRMGAEILRDDAKAMAMYRSWHGLSSEFDAMQADPIRDMACSIALTHHERWDGTGYPEGLAGEAIPLEGRIVAISDAYDALLSERPYKPALPEPQALSILREGVGRQFDPRVHAAFEASLGELRSVQMRFADPVPKPGAMWQGASSLAVAAV